MTFPAQPDAVARLPLRETTGRMSWPLVGWDSNVGEGIDGRRSR
jgi:hypothetical protein